MVVYNHFVVDQYIPAGPVYDYGSYEMKESIDSELMSDQVTPGWRRRGNKRSMTVFPVDKVTTKGRFPCTSYVSRQTTTDIAAGSVLSDNRYRYTGSGRSMHYDMGDLRVGEDLTGPANIGIRTDLIYPFRPELTSAAILGVYSKIGQSDALVAVTVAESKKTLDLCETLVLRMRSFVRWMYRNDVYDLPSGPAVVRYIKHGKRMRRDVIRLTGVLASEWLQYRYGIMPLIYDLQSYIALLQGAGTRVRYVSNVAGPGDPFSSDTGWVATNLHVETRMMCTRAYSHRASAGLFVSAKTEIDNTGILRIGSTAWELVPFSFVADWFVNVNDVIAATEGRFTRNIVSGWYTDVVNGYAVYTRNDRGRNYSSGGYYYQGYGTVYDGSSEESTYRYRRNPLSSFSAVPGFRVKLNWKRFTDLAALGRGLASSARLRQSVRF